MSSIKLVIELPFEYETTDATSPQVRKTIAHVLPYDPDLEAVRKAGGKVTITVEGEPVSESQQPPQEESPVQPSTESKPATKKDPRRVGKD